MTCVSRAKKISIIFVVKDGLLIFAPKHLCHVTFILILYLKVQSRVVFLVSDIPVSYSEFFRYNSLLRLFLRLFSSPADVQL